ncbi:VOC family protein [Oryzobacter telluris]|uniref:VOC family protein n=1 Tax=Oryzobacter telluris TaxID=3149179 RepID=UPI00370DD77D
MSTVRWAWIFLDTPAPDAEASWRFWSEVTRTSVAPTRGDDGEFSTLVPPRGGAWVKLQAVGDPSGGVHLDLDVDDVHTEAARAESLGAERVGAIGDTVVVLRSPGGFTFCLTTYRGEEGDGLVREGLEVALDQVCLDVPRAAWDVEAAFWPALTGWELRDSDEPGFAYLVRPGELAVRLLLQRVEEDDGQVRGHVDLACADRAAETQRHVAAGASVVREHHFWTVMADPVGRVYCLTSRSPQPPPGR